MTTSNSPPKRARWVVLSFVVIVVAGLFVFWLQRERTPDEGLRLYGNVDIREVALAFRQPGRLARMLFDEGDSVAVGELMAVIDATPYRERMAAAEAELAHLKALVTACRNLRGEMNISPAQRVPLYALGDNTFIAQHEPLLMALAKLSEVRVFASEAEWAQAAQNAPVAIAGDARLALFVEVDVAAEKERLQKEAERLQQQLAKANGKLANQAFVGKAPPQVVEQERQRAAEFGATLQKVQAQLARLA